MPTTFSADLERRQKPSGCFYVEPLHRPRLEARPSVEGCGPSFASKGMLAIRENGMTIKAIWLWWTSNSPTSEKIKKIRQETDQMLKRQEVQKELQKADELSPSH